MKYLLPAVAVGCVAAYAGYIFFDKQNDTKNLSIPHVFYSVKTITSIDAQGNSTGNEAVYRVDGIDGQPVKVVDLPNGSSGATWTPSTITYDVWSRGELLAGGFRFTYDNLGNKVWPMPEYLKTAFRNSIGDVVRRDQWVHPAGTFVVVSEVFCTDAPEEGPCSQSTRLVVTNLENGAQQTYSVEKFEVEDGAWNLQVIAAPSSTTGIIQVASSQEPVIYRVGVFDFSSGALSRTLYNSSNPPSEYPLSQFLRVSDDKKYLYFVKTFVPEGTNDEVYAIDIETGAVSNVISVPRMIEYSWPENSTSLYYKPADDRIIKHDVITGKDLTILWNKPIADYLDQKRFIVEQSQSTTGVYGGKLVVIDTATGRQRIVYDQLHDENAYGPNINGGSVSNNAVVGDKVFRFLGLEQ